MKIFISLFLFIKMPETNKRGRGKYLAEFVYGGIDGSVTTFAVVAGAIGASLGSAVILILGFANLFADGFSMAVSNYLLVKSEKELHYRKKYFKYLGHDHGKNPLKTAAATFLSFLLVGFAPLLFFILALIFPSLESKQFLYSIILTALAFIFIGFVKGEIVGKNRIKSSIETLLIGGFAALLAYIVGYLLKGLVG